MRVFASNFVLELWLVEVLGKDAFFSSFKDSLTVRVKLDKKKTLFVNKKQLGV